MSRRRRSAQQGFSLLELLVAFAIMAISLGMLYQATGTDARNIGKIQQAQRAAVLAESLLARRDAVPETGWNETGDVAGFSWRISSALYATAVRNPTAPPLHEIAVSIAWRGDNGDEHLDLVTLRPQRKAVALRGAP